MPLSHDTILMETVRTRRTRLQSALLHGELARRRVVPDNVKRLVGSLVLAAVACLGCVGFAVVASMLAARDGGAHPTPGRPAVTSSTGLVGGTRP